MRTLSRVMSEEAERQFWEWCDLTFPYFEQSDLPMPSARSFGFRLRCLLLWIVREVVS